MEQWNYWNPNPWKIYILHVHDQVLWLIYTRQVFRRSSPPPHCIIAKYYLRPSLLIHTCIDGAHIDELTWMLDKNPMRVLSLSLSLSLSLILQLVQCIAWKWPRIPSCSCNLDKSVLTVIPLLPPLYTMWGKVWIAAP